LLVFAIIALPSTLASLDNEKDDIVPEKGNAPVEFANKIMRGLEFLATKVEKTHHASKAQPESAVQVESNVNSPNTQGAGSSGMEEPSADNTTNAPTPPQDLTFSAPNIYFFASCASEHYGCCPDDTTHNSCASLDLTATTTGTNCAHSTTPNSCYVSDPRSEVGTKGGRLEPTADHPQSDEVGTKGGMEPTADHPQSDEVGTKGGRLEPKADDPKNVKRKKQQPGRVSYSDLNCKPPAKTTTISTAGLCLDLNGRKTGRIPYHCKIVIIDESVTSIGSMAFANSPLTSVTIGDSVTSIGLGAFAGSKITSITIGKSVTTIGPSAFAGTTSLTSVTMSGSVTSIGAYAFAGTSITSITTGSVKTLSKGVFMNTPLKKVIIGDELTSIGSYAFANTKLTRFKKPTEATVGAYAFLGTRYEIFDKDTDETFGAVEYWL
jgi:hypothetical protein